MDSEWAADCCQPLNSWQDAPVRGNQFGNEAVPVSLWKSKTTCCRQIMAWFPTVFAHNALLGQDRFLIRLFDDMSLTFLKINLVLIWGVAALYGGVTMWVMGYNG